MQEGTLKEIEVHERMNPVSQGSGGRYRRKTITVRRKRRGIGGIELTQQARYDGTNNTLQGSELHERQLRLGDETWARCRKPGTSEGETSDRAGRWDHRRSNGLEGAAFRAVLLFGPTVLCTVPDLRCHAP